MINYINKPWPMVLLYVINSLRISLFFCLDLIKTFLKNKETSWRRTNTPKIKSSEKSANSIKIEVLSTYVLSGSKGSKYTYSADQIRKKRENWITIHTISSYKSNCIQYAMIIFVGIAEFYYNKYISSSAMKLFRLKTIYLN